MIRNLIAALFVATIMGGCSQTVVPPARITPPSARLMVPPATVEEIKPGSDLVVEHLKLRRQYLKEVARLQSLQGYVRTMRQN